MARKQVMEAQADIIETVLIKHKIKARVTGGDLLPRNARFFLSTQVGERIKGIRGLLDEMALALGVRSARLEQSAEGLAIEVPRPDPKTVSLIRMIDGVGSPGPVRPLLGLGRNKVPIIANLNSPEVAHVLVSGTTGSGKTSLVRTMILSVAMWSTTQELGMVLIDPKGTEFSLLAKLPHLITDIITDPWTATRALESLVENLDKDPSERRLLIVIDEVADLIMTVGRSATHALTRLTQRGRSAHYHIIAATQKPTAEVLGSLFKANFPLRLVGRVTSPEEAKTASGYAGTGAEKLSGVGEFVAVTYAERNFFSAAHATPGQTCALIQEIQARAGPPRGSRLIIPPAPDPNPIAYQLEIARPVWAIWRDGSGGLQRGGHIAMAKALYGPAATGAGHQHRNIKTIIAALESDDLQGVYDPPGTPIQARATAQTSQRPLEGSEPSGDRPGVGLAPGGFVMPPPPVPTDPTYERPLEGSSDLTTRWEPALLRKRDPEQGSGRGSKNNEAV